MQTFRFTARAKVNVTVQKKGDRMGKKVIVAGHACLDITPLFPQNQQAAKLGNILSPGKLIQMEVLISMQEVRYPTRVWQ